MPKIDAMLKDVSYVECTQFARVKVDLPLGGPWTDIKVRLADGGKTAFGDQIVRIEVGE